MDFRDAGLEVDFTLSTTDNTYILTVLAAPVCFCGQTLCISVTVLCFYVGSWRKPFSRWVFHVLLQKCEKTLPLRILLVCRAGTEEDLKSHTQSWESAPLLLSGSILKDYRKVLMLIESVWFFSKGDLGYWGPLPSSHSSQKQASPRRPWIGGQLKWWWWEHVVENIKWWQKACPHFSC